MAHFECNKCGHIKEVKHYRLKADNHNIVSPDAVCCDTYMKRLTNYVQTEEDKRMKAIMQNGNDGLHYEQE